MRTMAIGDIHGCFTALEVLLRTAEVTSEDLLVLLGDYIDRGPDSKAVVDTLIGLNTEPNVVCLRGNHEEMVLEARSNPLQSKLWRSFGGEEALHSYGAGYREDWQDCIPTAHWRFFEDTRLWHETETHVFVHANVVPDREMAEQPDSVLLWERFTERVVHQSGKMVVCGHTPQPEGRPTLAPGSVCIDTAACRGGWLTCLDVHSRKYWQAQEDASTRCGQL